MEIFNYEVVPLEDNTSFASNFEQRYSCSVDTKDEVLRDMV